MKPLGLLGAGLLAAGLAPGLARIAREGLDGWSTLGLLLAASGTAVAGTEYLMDAEWTLPGRIGARYAAFAMTALGSSLCFRDRRHLCALGIGGLAWDLSSALFWAALKRDPRARVPVPWRHHFQQGEPRGGGAPCWLVALVDSCGILLFARLRKSGFDPLRLFLEGGGGGRKPGPPRGERGHDS